MSGVYEIRQLSELLITINILQSEIRLSEEDAKVILGYMQGHDFMLVLDVGPVSYTHLDVYKRQCGLYHDMYMIQSRYYQEGVSAI